MTSFDTSQKTCLWQPKTANGTAPLVVQPCAGVNFLELASTIFLPGFNFAYPNAIFAYALKQIFYHIIIMAPESRGSHIGFARST